MWSKTVVTDNEIINSFMTRNSILGQTFCGKWGRNIYIVSWNNCLHYLLWHSLLVCAFYHCLSSVSSLWITLNIIAIQSTTMIRGPVKIKYTLDPIFYASLNYLTTVVRALVFAYFSFICLFSYYLFLFMQITTP